MYGKKIEKFSIDKTYAILKKQNLSTFGGAYSNNYTTQGIYRKFNNSYKKKAMTSWQLSLSLQLKMFLLQLHQPFEINTCYHCH